MVVGGGLFVLKLGKRHSSRQLRIQIHRSRNTEQCGQNPSFVHFFYQQQGAVPTAPEVANTHRPTSHPVWLGPAAAI